MMEGDLSIAGHRGLFAGILVGIMAIVALGVTVLPHDAVPSTQWIVNR